MAASLRLYRPKPAVDRRFGSLVLLSLLLHGSLFVLMAESRPAAPPALPTLMATLRLPELPPAAAPAPVPMPAALPQKVRPSPVAAVNRPAPRRPETAVPAIVPAAPVAEAGPSAAPAMSAAVTAPPVALAATVPPAAAATTQSPEALAAYRRRLTELLGRHQDYPRLAALRGWQGEVRLRLRVARRGNLLAVDVERSSGFAVLDQHAQAMLADMGGLPPLPEGLEGSEIQVVVPITYKLNEAT
ncbi:MAG: hypothetical protein CVU18_14610 [Betaproteobacteria bacterium HGW-Betaproteobacteria-12]|nr:MAG: hypothetical protein CVU18_14610 [Betaproteobacteria bacterium HGW-Betaproteobacteria-12]